MSAYTSQNWLNGSAFYPLPVNPRGPLDAVDRRVLGMEVRQNGHSHVEDLPNRDSPHLPDEPPHAYNRSVVNAKENFQDRHSSPVPYSTRYSPPPERDYYPPSPRRGANYNHYNGPPQELPYPLKRGSLLMPGHPQRNVLPQPHSVRPWSPSYRARRPVRFHNYRPSLRPNGPSLLPYPGPRRFPRHGFHDQSHQYVPHSEVHSFRDPRMNRQNSADAHPNQQIHTPPESTERQTADHILREKLNQIREEHSYCLTSPAEEKSEPEKSEPESWTKSCSDLSTQHFLTSIPKCSSVNVTSQKRPVTVQFLTPTSYWPVAESYSCTNFSMDLDDDLESDYASEDERKKEAPHIGNSILVDRASKSGKRRFRNRRLRNHKRSSRMSQVLDEHEVMCVESPSECEESSKILSEESPVKTEDKILSDESPEGLNSEQQHNLRLSKKPQLRQSKRLSRIKLTRGRKDKTWMLSQEDVSDEIELSETPSEDTVSNELKPPLSEEKKTEVSLQGTISNELKLLLSGDFAPEILTSRSRAESQALARRQLMEKEMEQHERERIQTARKETDTEDSGVVSDGPNLSNTTLTNDTPSEHSATMTSSSTLTAPSSSSLDMSQDQTSSSMESGSQYLESSLHDLDLSDYILDNFPPELVSRCKKITFDRSSGDTPLHRVCRNGKLDMVRCLLFHLKTDPNVTDNAGWTPLHEACSNDRLIVANLLLKSGADANASATDGTRPIHDAVEVGALNIVKSLVEHGADPTAELGEKTPLDLAKDFGHPDIYGYLQPVVKEYQARRKVPTMSSAAPSTTQKVMKYFKEVPDENILTLPVNGYTEDDPSFGKELDFPLFYICPTLELSETPLLPVYNFEIVPGSNPRKHNFYLLPELLQALNMNEGQLRLHCADIAALELTVAEFLLNLQRSDYVPPPAIINTVSLSTKLKFLPVCSQLQQLLNIQTVNLDD